MARARNRFEGTYGDTNVAHAGEASRLVAGHVGFDIFGGETGGVFLRLLQTVQIEQN